MPLRQKWLRWPICFFDRLLTRRSSHRLLVIREEPSTTLVSHFFCQLHLVAQPVGRRTWPKAGRGGSRSGGEAQQEQASWREGEGASGRRGRMRREQLEGERVCHPPARFAVKASRHAALLWLPVLSGRACGELVEQHAQTGGHERGHLAEEEGLSQIVSSRPRSTDPRGR